MDIVERTSIYINRIKERDSELKAFIEIWENDAIESAKKIEKKEKKGRLYPMVAAIKDNMLLYGKEITAGSKILKGHLSTYTATAVKRLIDEDAVIIGRTNMDEFAMGSSNENSSYFITRNPLNKDYVPGGSSGGSAAAVASDLCDFSLGSDTGGSIRQPASFCGIYGLKPTYGTVSRYGLIAFASGLDQIGPFAKNIEDIKKVYDVIKGYDKNDSTTYKEFKQVKSKKLSEMKIGIIDFDYNGCDEDVIKNFEEAVLRISKKVSNVTKIKIPHLKYAISSYYIIASSEASSNLARFDSIKYGKYEDGADLESVYMKNRGNGFGAEVKRRIILGTYALSAGYYDEYYLKAQKIRALVKRDFEESFKNVDILMIPTTPTTAFKIGEKIDNPLSMYLNDIFTVPVNLAGIAALSAPYGKDRKNLPSSVQFIANKFCEEYLFESARGLL